MLEKAEKLFNKHETAQKLQQKSLKNGKMPNNVGSF